MVTPIKDMTVDVAKKLAQDLKNNLRKYNIWCTVTEVNEPDLKFIKIEASIKVRQEND